MKSPVCQKIFLALALCFVAGIMSGCLGSISKKVVGEAVSSGSEKVVGDLLKSNLKTYTFYLENSSLKIDLPFSLNNVNVPNKDLKTFYDEYTRKAIFMGEANNTILVQICAMTWDKRKIEYETGETFYYDLDGALMGGIESTPDVQSYDSIKDYRHNGIYGREVTYYITKNSLTAPCRTVVFSKGADSWLILVGRLKNDTKTNQLSDKIFDSMRLD